MNKEFVPCHLSSQLKDLGFDEECLGYYSNLGDYLILRTRMKKTNSEMKNVSAPLWQQVFDWFAKQGIYSYIEPVYCEDAVSKIKFDYFIREMECEDEEYENLPYHTYEEAQEALLIQLIKNLKNKL